MPEIDVAIFFEKRSFHIFIFHIFHVFSYFHEFSYILELRESGSLEVKIENEIKLVSQKENVLEESHSYIVYVNYPVTFKEKEEEITIVNTKYFELPIFINDYNVDALLKLEKLTGEKNAGFQLYKFESKEEKLDSILVETEKLVQISKIRFLFFLR